MGDIRGKCQNISEVLFRQHFRSVWDAYTINVPCCLAQLKWVMFCIDMHRYEQNFLPIGNYIDIPVVIWFWRQMNDKTVWDDHKIFVPRALGHALKSSPAMGIPFPWKKVLILKRSPGDMARSVNILVSQPSLQWQCIRKPFMVHQTIVRGALYILFIFVKSLIRHLGLAIGNVQHVRWFSWTLQRESLFLEKWSWYWNVAQVTWLIQWIF